MIEYPVENVTLRHRQEEGTTRNLCLLDGVLRWRSAVAKHAVIAPDSYSKSISVTY